MSNRRRHEVRPASTLDYLIQYYGPNITLNELSSITTQGVRTIQNAIVKGEYPIPSFKIGYKRVFRLVDVATYLDEQFVAANGPKTARRRGRPTKVQQLARRRAERTGESSP